MNIRYATKHDISAISEVEAKCFPPSEAASEKAFTERIENYGNHFWLMYENDKLIAFVDGFVTDESDLTDEMFADAAMHNENGAWQMIFGVNTLPLNIEITATQASCFAVLLMRQRSKVARAWF